MSDYTIERGLGVRSRMDLLAAVFGPSTVALLDQVGVASGARCLDLGCGGGHVAVELGRRVGASGSVIGIDLDADLLEVARAGAVAQGWTNVVFQVAAVEDVTEHDLDFAFARMLLMHLRDPAGAVASMVGMVRSGGVVAVEDINFAGSFTYPPCPAYDRRVAWYQEAVRRRGGDADLGPRLPGLLAAAGLVDVGVRVVQPAYLTGPNKHLQELSMAKQKTAVVESGVVSAEEYDAAHAELVAFTVDPTTLVAAPRMVQAWGRRP
jgi:SAM-dependent methyltransferase